MLERLFGKKALIWCFILVGLGIFHATYAAISGSYQTAYSYFHLRSNALYNIDMPLTINVDPGVGSSRYFSEQMAIGPYTAYIGLQTDMLQQDGTIQKGAIFSIWNATAATPGSAGSWCKTFGGEGTGFSCRMAYPWSQGTTYRLRVWEITSNSWAAFVKDLTSGNEVYLGTITLPTSKYLLQGNIVTFTEYYGGDFQACNDLKLSRVTWGMPVGNNGTVSSTWVSNSVGPGECDNIRFSEGTGPTVQSVGS